MGGFLVGVRQTLQSEQNHIREETNMGDVPSRIVGVFWIDDIGTSAVPTKRLSFLAQPQSRFRLNSPSDSVIPADLDQLETELQAAFELVTSR